MNFNIPLKSFVIRNGSDCSNMVRQGLKCQGYMLIGLNDCQTPFSTFHASVMQCTLDSQGAYSAGHLSPWPPPSNVMSSLSHSVNGVTAYMHLSDEGAMPETILAPRTTAG